MDDVSVFDFYLIPFLEQYGSYNLAFGGYI